jgi:hypothetical protein
VWATLASPLVGSSLYVKLQTAPNWSASLDHALNAVLIPVVKSGALAVAPVWALAAAATPLLTRSRSLTVNTVLVVAWAALTVSFAQAALTLGQHHIHPVATIPTATVGAIAAAAIVLAPRLVNAAQGRLSVPRFST